MSNTPGIELYPSSSGGFELSVHADAETVWLSADQLVALFGRDKSTISRHLRNVFVEGELDRDGVVADFATTAADGKTYTVVHYNLDVIISVGYRVKSVEGVRFRRWATQVLRSYLLEGVALDARRLEQLGSIVQVLSRSSDELVAGVAEVVDRYVPSLRTLRDYDSGQIDESPGTAPTWQLTYEEARSLIDQVAAEFPADTLFGGERGGSLRGVVALFVHFLARNHSLDDRHGVPRMSNNALAAITLMVAMSDPKEKELMIALVVSMLADDAR